MSIFPDELEWLQKVMSGDDGNELNRLLTRLPDLKGFALGEAGHENLRISQIIC